MCFNIYRRNYDMLLLVTIFALITFKKISYLCHAATRHQMFTQYNMYTWWFAKHAQRTFTDAFFQILNFKLFKYTYCKTIYIFKYSSSIKINCEEVNSQFKDVCIVDMTLLKIEGFENMSLKSKYTSNLNVPTIII